MKESKATRMMHSYLLISLLIAVWSLSCGAAESTSTEKKSGAAVLDQEKWMAPFTDSIFAEMNIRKDILDAFFMSRRLSGSDMYLLEDGSYCGDRRFLDYAYAYYGKQVTGIYSDLSHDAFDSINLLAVMEDGSLYNGVTKLSKNTCIWDVQWKPSKTNNEAWILNWDGTLSFYDPLNTKYLEKEELGYYASIPCVSAICRSDGEIIAFVKDGGAISIYDNDEPFITELLNEEYWGNAKNIVRSAFACKYDTGTLVAISADGTVYAKGEYADEILSLGPISDIQYVRGFFIALTPEGDLKFVGGDGPQVQEKFRDVNVKFAGIKVLENQCSVIDVDGNIYSLSFSVDGEGGYIYELYKNSIEGRSKEGFRMDPDGNVLKNANGASLGSDGSEEEMTVFEETSEVNAAASENWKILYYRNLLEGTYSDGYGFEAEQEDLPAGCSYAMYDLDGDGEDELFLKTDTEFYVMDLYMSELTKICSEYFDYLEGYYPETKVFVLRSASVSEVTGDAYEDRIYYQIKGGVCNTVMQYTNLSGEETYRLPGEWDYEKLPYTDESGEDLRTDNPYLISEGEFEAYLDYLTDGEQMQQAEMEFDMLPMAEEGLTKIFIDAARTDTGSESADQGAATEAGYQEGAMFQFGLLPWLAEGTGWGYVTPAGEWKIPPQFQYAKPFYKNGYALVEDKESGFFNCIDINGNLEEFDPDWKISGLGESSNSNWADQVTDTLIVRVQSRKDPEEEEYAFLMWKEDHYELQLAKDHFQDVSYYEDFTESGYAVLSFNESTTEAVIDTNLSYVIEPGIYSEIYEVAGGIFWARPLEDDEKMIRIDARDPRNPQEVNRQITDYTSGVASEGCIIADEIVMDSYGNITFTLDEEYEDYVFEKNFSESDWAVIVNSYSEYYFVDMDGNIVFEEAFDEYDITDPLEGGVLKNGIYVGKAHVTLDEKGLANGIRHFRTYSSADELLSYDDDVSDENYVIRTEEIIVVMTEAGEILFVPSERGMRIMSEFYTDGYAYGEKNDKKVVVDTNGDVLFSE